MSAIDAVIARARQPGEMQTRKRFTVARKRAIQKMRKFALADPHHYILELIQSAIANGAAYVDIRVDADTCTVAYIGGGLHEKELAQLFDFLFASKDRTDVAHVRTLAMGLNAALRFEPRRIIVESGSEGMGTTRMELMPGTDEVTIGKPETGLLGTFIRIEGMNRRALGKSWRHYRDANPPREIGVIEERCLTAPIPIWVDGQPVFGFGSQRIPRIGGYRKTITFDEGDLYGVLGLDPSWGTPSFSLLTYGVHIQSKSRHVNEGKNVGGIICFDALHKTVDHSGIVEDSRYEEMFARLSPYVRQLVSGREEHQSPYEVHVFGHDKPLAVRELRELLVDASQIVWVLRDSFLPSHEAEAQGIANALGAPLLLGVGGSLDEVRNLAGEGTHFIFPELGGSRDLAHYQGAAAGPPRRPWLTDAKPAGELDQGALADLVLSVLPHTLVSARALKQALGRAAAQVEVFTPRTGTEVRRSRVELRAADRVFHTVEHDDMGPGHVVVAEFPELSVERLHRAAGDGYEDLCEVLVEAALEISADEIDQSAAEVVRRLVDGHVAGPQARSIGLYRLAHTVVPRLDLNPNTPELDFVRLSDARSLEAVALFETHDGQAHTLADLERLSSQGEGLLYGTHPNVSADLEGLNPARILDLDVGGEAALLSMLGGTGYTRVDARDVLARAGAFVVRDRAFGLRGPAFDSLAWEVEGALAQTRGPGPDDAERAALVRQLVQRGYGDSHPRPTDPDALPEWVACRDEAQGHVRRYVCARLVAGLPLEGPPELFATLPLLASGDGRTVRVAGLTAALAGRGIALLYGEPAPDVPEIASTDRGAAHRYDEALVLRVDAFTAHWLKQLAAAHGATLPAAAQAPEEPLLEHTRSESQGSARLWLATGGGPAQVDILHADGSRRIESDLSARYGVGGVVRVTGDRGQDPSGRLLLEAARDLWRKCLAELRDKGTDHERGAQLLDMALSFLRRNCHFVRDEGGRLRHRYADPLVVEFGRLPLFPQGGGGSVSLVGLMHSLSRLAAGVDPRAAALADCSDKVPARVRTFLERALDPEHIRWTRRPASIHLPSGEDRDDAAARIHAWLDALRPDELRLERVYVVQYESEVGFSYGHGVLRVMADSPVAQPYLQAPTPLALARLLMSAYAFINAVYDEVTAEHELAFQRAVSRALRAGTLDPSRLPR